MLTAEFACMQTFQSNFCIQANSVIRLLLEEHSDLGPQCLQKWLLKSQADDKADDNCCDWQFKGQGHIKKTKGWQWKALCNQTP